MTLTLLLELSKNVLVARATEVVRNREEYSCFKDPFFGVVLRLALAQQGGKKGGSDRPLAKLTLAIEVGAVFPSQK
jgi:hypothetical protein